MGNVWLAARVIFVVGWTKGFSSIGTTDYIFTPPNNNNTTRNCKIQEFNGYLQYMCPIPNSSPNETSPIRLNYFKCAFSDIYYSINAYHCNWARFSGICDSDPLFYQHCGSYMPCKDSYIRHSSPLGYLCGSYVCESEKNSTIYYVSGSQFVGFVTCDNRTDCSSGVDEAICDGDWYKCDFTFDYKFPYQVCDGVCDCTMCDDENGCGGHYFGLWCNMGYEIVNYAPPLQLCNVKPLCLEGEDKAICDISLPGVLRTCTSASTGKIIPLYNYTMCASIIWNHKGTSICKGFLDQMNCSSPDLNAMGCLVGGYPTELSYNLMCSSHRPIIPPICDDGLDQWCVELSASCTIHKHLMCDGMKDCFDGEDEDHNICRATLETSCYRRHYNRNLLRVPGAIPLLWVKDGQQDCEDGEDEEPLEWWSSCGLTNRSFRYISKGETCKDVFLCPEGNKLVNLEDLCDRVESCWKENEVCSLARNLHDATSSFQVVEKDGLAYNVLAPCLPGLNSLQRLNFNCSYVETYLKPYDIFGVDPLLLSIPETSVQLSCSSFYGDSFLSLACTNKCKDATCPLDNQRLLHSSCPGQYPSRVFSLANREFLTFVRKHKDEFIDNIFECMNGKCVTYDKVCNLADDCGDLSDEMNCTNSISCKNSNERVPLGGLCDGKFDCLDFSDECNDRCRKEIIESTFLKVFAWTAGIFATFLNAIIIFKNGRRLRASETFPSILNTTLIVIIALGDFIQGLYLITIAYIDTQYKNSGKYCENQFEWLTSGACSAIGCISTIASQLSLFSMSVLGLSRLIRMQTFSLGGSLSPSSFILLLVIVIIIVGSSSLIAIIPLIPSLENFFVNGLYYPGSRLFVGSITKTHHLRVFRGYYGRLQEKYISWNTIAHLVDGMFSADYGNVKRRTVDFYGNDGVCLFKYFVTPTDPQRSYSWAILTVNFICFMAITASYIFINFTSITSTRQFKESAHMKHIRRRNTRLQRKISFIIATDFLCWVPFLISCFLHSLLVIDASPYYSFFSIVVLPINSVINPLLYDDSISKIFRKVIGMRNITGLQEKSTYVKEVITRRRLQLSINPSRDGSGGRRGMEGQSAGQESPFGPISRTNSVVEKTGDTIALNGVTRRTVNHLGKIREGGGVRRTLTWKTITEEYNRKERAGAVAVGAAATSSETEPSSNSVSAIYDDVALSEEPCKEEEEKQEEVEKGEVNTKDK